jgi:hypothetical protein
MQIDYLCFILKTTKMNIVVVIIWPVTHTLPECPPRGGDASAGGTGPLRGRRPGGGRRPAAASPPARTSRLPRPCSHAVPPVRTSCVSGSASDLRTLIRFQGSRIRVR